LFKDRSNRQIKLLIDEYKLDEKAVREIKKKREGLSELLNIRIQPLGKRDFSQIDFDSIRRVIYHTFSDSVYYTCKKIYRKQKFDRQKEKINFYKRKGVEDSPVIRLERASPLKGANFMVGKPTGVAVKDKNSSLISTNYMDQKFRIRLSFETLVPEEIVRTDPEFRKLMKQINDLDKKKKKGKKHKKKRKNNNYVPFPKRSK
jgi:hypothetical protein